LRRRGDLGFRFGLRLWHFLKGGDVCLVVDYYCLEMGEGTVDGLFQLVVGDEGNLRVPTDLYAFSRIDVHALTVPHGDEFERSEAFYLYETVGGKSFFDDIEEGTAELFGLPLGETFSCG
jgi:hypothetical protein